MARSFSFPAPPGYQSGCELLVMAGNKENDFARRVRSGLLLSGLKGFRNCRTTSFWLMNTRAHAFCSKIGSFLGLSRPVEEILLG